MEPLANHTQLEKWTREGKPYLEEYKGNEKLEGKAAIITGGDSGIGRTVSASFIDVEEFIEIEILKANYYLNIFSLKRLQFSSLEKELILLSLTCLRKRKSKSKFSGLTRSTITNYSTFRFSSHFFCTDLFISVLKRLRNKSKLLVERLF